MTINPQILDEISTLLSDIPWFSRCGTSIDEPCKSKSPQVDSWDSAIDLCSSLDWSNTTLEARNDLTSFLSLNYHRKLRDWNEDTRDVKVILAETVSPKVKDYQIKNRLPDEFFDCVEWDVLAAMMEIVYFKTNPPRFFDQLLRIYSQGHFPCGWDGEWPNGTLLYY